MLCNGLKYYEAISIIDMIFYILATKFDRKPSLAYIYIYGSIFYKQDVSMSFWLTFLRLHINLITF